MASLDTPDLKEDAAADLINTAKALQGNRIDLSRRKLLSIPDQLLDLRKLEFLYLEGNLLVNLPDAIFENLTSLKWVDLRNNRLSEIPRSIGKHRALKSLLLDGNKLTSLPVELGLVKTITGIHLVDNPLEFPPRNVVEQGTQEILKFLRNQLPLEEAECPEATADDKAPIPAKGKSRHGEERTLTSNESSEEEDNFPPLPVMKWSVSQSLSETSLNGSGEIPGLFTNEKGKTQLVQNKKRKDVKSYSSSTRKRESAPHLKKQPIGTPSVESKSSTIEASIDLGLSKNESIEPDKSRNLIKKKRKSPRKIIKEKKRTEIPDEIRYDKETSFEMMKEAEQLEKEEQLKGPEIHALLREKMAAEEKKKNEQTKFDPGHLARGDMVALRMPSKHFIPGQPCVGQIVGTMDVSGLLLIHYFTGSYEGVWRPMMSRSSPYLRRVPTGIVVCKFTLNEESKMEPDTIKLIKEAVGEQ